MRGTGADRPVVAMRPGNAGGAKGTGRPGSLGGQPPWVGGARVSEPKPKPFEISKWAVWEAYRRVKANKDAAGVDEQSIAEFERDPKGTSTSSGTGSRRGAISRRRCARWRYRSGVAGRGYSACPPSPTGSPRRSSPGTWSSRWSLTSTRLPTGIGPAARRWTRVGACRERCWREDWVVDLDLKSFFDSVPHDLVLRAVARHTDLRWVLLYVERWLKGPLEHEDGSLVERDRGTPQGSAISPLLANVFLHYAFDRWMAREFPVVRFERYCDDVMVHARSEQRARDLRGAIASRLAACGLELNERKTRIVYCKDANRRGSYEHESLTSSATRSAPGCRRAGTESTS
jgi:RNA-directed DNA polymerase